MAKAKLIYQEQGEGFPFHQEQFPCNQLDDVPTDIPVGERACSPHTGVNIHNGYTARVNTGEIPPCSPASPCGVCSGGNSTGVASGNGMLHPTRHRDGDGSDDEDEDRDGDASAISHMPAELPIGEQLQTAPVPLQTARSELAAAPGTLPPATGCWSSSAKSCRGCVCRLWVLPSLLCLSCLRLRNGNESGFIIINYTPGPVRCLL